MRRTRMLWEVFVSRFQEAFEQYEKLRLTGHEAGPKGFSVLDDLPGRREAASCHRGVRGGTRSAIIVVPRRTRI
jgi:hypothetical protein